MVEFLAPVIAACLQAEVVLQDTPVPANPFTDADVRLYRGSSFLSGCDLGDDGETGTVLASRLSDSLHGPLTVDAAEEAKAVPGDRSFPGPTAGSGGDVGEPSWPCSDMYRPCTVPRSSNCLYPCLPQQPLFTRDTSTKRQVHFLLPVQVVEFCQSDKLSKPPLSQRVQPVACTASRPAFPQALRSCLKRRGSATKELVDIRTSRQDVQCKQSSPPLSQHEPPHWVSIASSFLSEFLDLPCLAEISYLTMPASHSKEHPRSQRVQPLASTASVLRPLPERTVEPEHDRPRPVFLYGTDKAAHVTCAPKQGGYLSELRMSMAARVQIQPEYLDRPELRNRMLTDFEWVTGHRATSAVDSSLGQFDRYTVFDTAYHARTRHLPRGWTVNHLISELVSLYPRLKQVVFLQDKLPDLPSVQVAVSMRDFAPGQCALPIDFRSFEGRICTIRASPGMDPEAIRDICRHHCPQDRLPRRPFAIVDSEGLPLAIPLPPEPFPDFGRGVSLEDARVEPQPEEEATALLQTGTQVRISEVPHAATLPDGQTDTACVCKELRAGAPHIMLPPNPDDPRQPPALLWHNFRELEAKSGDSATESLPRLTPAYFQVATRQNQAAMKFSWGRVDGASNEAFSTFDVIRHAIVRPRSATATLQEIVEDAVADAPFIVQAVQVLTYNVPGFPRPQLILHRREDDPLSLPIPWDLRSIGGRVRTALHFPSESFDTSVAAVQRVCPELPELQVQLAERRVVALDATGVLGGNLPENLEEIQFVTVEPSAPLWFTFATTESPDLRRWPFFGPTSTSTTTQVQGSHRRFRFVVLFGETQAQVEVHAPCLQADAILESLLMDVFSRSPPIYGAIHVMLARAQPLPVEGVQDVLFIVCAAQESEYTVTVADQSECGFAATTLTLVPFTRCEVPVPEPWNSQGVQLFVNAAPAHLAQRVASHGDVFRFSAELDRPVSTPTSLILTELPVLDPYAWPLHAGDRPFQLELTNTARLRRRQQRAWQHQEGLVEILGPTHGPIRFRIDDAVVPDLREAQAGLARIPGCPALGLPLFETRAIEPCRAVFVTGAPHSSLQTVLLPSYGHNNHFIVLLISQLAQSFGKLPLPRNCVLQNPGRPWRCGDLLDFWDLANCTVPFIPQIVARAPIPRPPRHTFGCLRADLDTYANNLRSYQERGLPLPESDNSLLYAVLREYHAAHAARTSEEERAQSEQPSSSGDPHGTSLLQIRKTLSRSAIPTPLGRRNITVAANATHRAEITTAHNQIDLREATSDVAVEKKERGVIRLSELLPSATCSAIQNGARSVCMQRGVTADMFDHMILPFFDCMQLDWESLPHLPTCARNFLAHLPRVEPQLPVEALQLYGQSVFWVFSVEHGVGWALWPPTHHAKVQLALSVPKSVHALKSSWLPSHMLWPLHVHAQSLP